MALYHENFVWPIENMPGLKKFMLVYIAREAERPSAEADLSIGEISFRCSISDSTVRSYLKELEQEGYLTKLKTSGKRLFYRVNVGNQARQSGASIGVAQ